MFVFFFVLFLVDSNFASQIREESLTNFTQMSGTYERPILKFTFICYFFIDLQVKLPAKFSSSYSDYSFF